MPIQLREDIVYILLKKISEAETTPAGQHQLDLRSVDLVGRELTPAALLGHLDYLNQRQYIKAEFSGNAYGNQTDVPDFFNPAEVEIRIANTFGAPDGPLPHLIEFQRAELTEKGRQMLEKMEANPPRSLREGPAVPIAAKDMPFLEKVMLKGNLEDIFDARDVTEVVFRTMRDMMTTAAADRVAAELHEPAEPSQDKALQDEIADLWQDTNPIVSFLSRLRPPLEIKPETFLFRIAQEAGLPRGTDPETVVRAVFGATKQELSPERVEEVARFLPGKIHQLWQEA